MQRFCSRAAASASCPLEEPWPKERLAAASGAPHTRNVPQEPGVDPNDVHAILEALFDIRALLTRIAIALEDEDEEEGEAETDF